MASLEEMSRTGYDVLIIGSGAGGGAVLWRLCDRWRNNGLRIGMVEAGESVIPTHRRNLAILSGGRGERLFANPEIMRRLGLTLPEFSGATQIFALGGRTLQWDVNAHRMPLRTLVKYPVPLKEMEAYYSLAEQVMKVSKPFLYEEINQLLINRLWAAGFLEATGPAMAIDTEPTRLGEIHSNAYFSSINFLAEAMYWRPFDLSVKARAVQIFTENGKAAGVKVMSPDQKCYVLHAKTIVVSASTFETPRLLLYSGIKGNAIGRYLIDHSMIRGTASISRAGLPENLGPVEVTIPESDVRPYQLQMYGRAQPSYDEVGIGSNGYGLVESRAENRIVLDPGRVDEYGVPAIQVHFSYTDEDLDVIRMMTAGMREAFSAMGATPVSVNGQPDICLRAPGSGSHESGTCRIGLDPATSAADPYGQIHGVSGLYAADNSVLPYLGTNPTLTTVALAIRTADHIIASRKGDA